MYKYLLACLIMTVFGAFGGFFFKKAADSGETIFRILFSPFLYIGGVFYVLGALLNIWVLKKINYTVVLPLTAITYVWTLVISYFILNEKLTIKKVAGILFIITGALILGIKA